MRLLHILPALALLAVLTLCVPHARAAELSTGQTLYAPVYSHVYHGPKTRPLELACMLSIRNTDPERGLTVTSVIFYNSHGGMVRRFMGAPKQLGPLETLEFHVTEDDNDGGSGANFIVEWSADDPVNPPLVESVMIGKGVSFASRAIELAP